MFQETLLKHICPMDEKHITLLSMINSRGNGQNNQNKDI